MKLSTKVNVILTALAGIPSMVSAIGCTMSDVGPASAWQWTIFDVPGVTDPNSLCNGLRDNIHGFGACTESDFFCRMVGDKFEWGTRVPVGCNQGMIEAVWWGATNNQYGAIDKCYWVN
jgi:hypothetical protein